MAHLSLSLLGPFQATLDGEPIAGYEATKVRALLAYLAVEARQPHPRLVLAGLLWPDRPERAALASLRNSLANLRKAIGDRDATPPFLLVTRETIQFNPASDYWLDVAAFCALVEATEAGQALSERLERAVALYRGDFLAGFSVRDSPEFEDWVLLTRERLQRKVLAALRRLIAHSEEDGEIGRACEAAWRQVELAPWEEEAHQQLMRLLAVNGQRGAALAQYEACWRALAEELGVEPGAETTALYEQIRVGKLEVPIPIRASAITSRSPIFLDEVEMVRPTRPVFVTRERELAWLTGYLDRALAGQGQAVFVTGGSGRGKTALMTAFGQRAMEAVPDLLLGMGSCDAYGGVGDPYLPFREALEMLTGDVEARWAAGAITRDEALRLWEALPDAVQALLQWGPHLAGALFSVHGLLSRARARAGDGPSWLSELEEYVVRSRSGAEDLEPCALFQQTSNVLRALAEEHPLLLILDDLQWVDPASASLLFHLGRRLVGARILIVGAYRPEELVAGRPSTGSGPAERHPLRQALSEFRRLFGDAWLDLSRVEEPERRHFVDALLDSPASPLAPNRLDEEYRRTLAQRTEGHPLFTVELLRAMQARGDLVQDGTGHWVQGQALDWERLPARVEGVIAARVERLRRALRELLTVASVEGERFTAQVVALVQGVPERQVLRWLSRELEARQRLVREAGEVQADGRFLARYQFAHSLYQSYLYKGLSAGERRLLHREVGAALETLYGEHRQEIATRLAHHYGAAGDEERERRYARLAGEQAAARYAHTEALRYLTRALELTPDTDGALIERWELLLAREEVNRRSGDRTSQAADLDMLERLTERTDDDRRASRQAEVACRRANLDHSSGDLTASANLAENAVRLAQQAGDTAREAQGYRQWAGTLHKQRELAAAHRKFEIGLDLAQEAGQRGLQGDCLSGLGWVCVDGWNLTVGEAYLGQALSIARELADRPREAMAIFNLGVLAYFRLDRVAAKDCCQQALKISQETGFRNSEILASNVLGSLHLRYGDYARAQTYAERGLRTGRETAAWDLVPYSLLCLGVQHQRTGDLQRSRGYALEALPLSRKMGRQDLEARSNFHIGVSFYFQGDHSAAQPYLQQAADLGREGGWPDRQDMGLTGLGLNAMAQGDYGVARDALERAQCLLREFPEQDVFARDDEAYAQSALALLHHRLGKDQQAVHYARRALEIHRATFGPDRPALALTRLGHALVGLGKFEDGRAAYQEALDLRRDLGQAHLATEPLAGLARVALAQGDVMGAKTCVEEILSHLEKSALASGGGHPLDGTDEPLRILLTCYRVLRANQDPRAEKLLTEGHQLLQERASKIEDERLRRSYLENVRAHREIVCEWEDLGRRS